MVYTDYEKDIVSDEEFSRIYKAIRENAIEYKGRWYYMCYHA